jgi:hypothetical protein
MAACPICGELAAVSQPCETHGELRVAGSVFAELKERTQSVVRGERACQAPSPARRAHIF